MPSPITANPSTNPRPLQLPSQLQGAVQSPDELPLLDGPKDAPAQVVSHSIEDKKTSAKAILADSGVNLNQHSGLDETAGRPHSLLSANRASSGRKRSRSGTPIATPRSAPGSSSRSIQEYKYLFAKEKLRPTDQHSTMALDDRRIYQEEVVKEIKNEEAYYKELDQIRRRDPGAIFGYGYMGYGNGLTEIRRPADLRYPFQARKPGNRKARTLHVPKKDRLAQAEQIEELVPLRLDIEFDKIKLRDTFTWNLHDRVTPTDVFAENLVEDFQLPPEIRPHAIQRIHTDLQEQLLDFYPHAFIEEEPLDSHQPYSAYKNDEMRILIKLNITIGQHTLVDQFEWDINDALNSPEDFARQMACDLSLSGEFTTAIAHSIREQCQMFSKSLYITGHPFDGRPVEDADIQDNFLPSPLPSVFRPMQSAKDYTPYLYELSEQELERAELSILREQRRQKRSVNRRGGPALPDLKDRQRTVRTLVVSSVLPGAAETIEESHIFKVSRSSKRSGARPGRIDGGDDSDESDSDDSIMESPAPAQVTGGTARTRGMRGAATAAQAAMRSAIGRSATPEVSTFPQHEPRSSARQLRYEAREESVSESSTFIVKLKINPKRFREHLQNPKQVSKPASTPVTAPTPPPARSTPANSMPPPPSPAMPPKTAPANGASSVEASPKPSSTSTETSQSQQQWRYAPDGRTDAPYPLPAGTTPAPPPPWLESALKELRERYPNDHFEAIMRYNIIDQSTGQSVKIDQLNPNNSLPANYKAQYLPRIRCNDCPGKLYTAGPGLTVENFEVHLKNRAHKANVDRRTGRQGSAAS